MRWLLALAATGCAAQPSPFFHDERYLRFGLDPRDEAETLIVEHRERGQKLALRLQGQHFTAVGFMEPNGRATGVRILTERGIVTSLDAESSSALGEGARYALLAPVIAGTHDADHDGFEEVFVQRRAGKSNCVLTYRVRDVGFVDLIETPLQLFGQSFCPERVEDVNSDGRAELVAEAELRAFPGATPTLRVPLWGVDHRFEARADPAALTSYVAHERARRQAELNQARRDLDARNMLRLAIELAALSQLAGEAAGQQLEQFDRALLGLVLTESLQFEANEARGLIYETWNVPALATPSPVGTTSSRLVHHARP